MGRNIKHGLSHSRINQIWRDMKQRCNNPKCCNYKHYGGRGISYCEEWEQFETFYEWAIANNYDDSLTLDRIDNNGNYEPNNCRFVTKRIQNINKRPSKRNTSGYVGIKKHSSGYGWYGSVKINNKDYYTGRSNDLIEAVKMRNDFIIKNGLDNKLNEVIEC